MHCKLFFSSKFSKILINVGPLIRFQGLKKSKINKRKEPFSPSQTFYTFWQNQIFIYECSILMKTKLINKFDFFIFLYFGLFISKVEPMCSNYVMPARPNSSVFTFPSQIFNIFIESSNHILQIKNSLNPKYFYEIF